MAKEVSKVVKLQVRGGAANPSPPVGPALGAAGVNIMEFCKQFNARTQDKQGKVLPVAITVYKDKSFDFVVKTPPAAIQILEAAAQFKLLFGLESGFFFGVLMSILVGVVIIGGIKRIGQVTEKIVPIMGIMFVGASLVIILMNVTIIPAAIVQIWDGAFTQTSVVGGIIGVMIVGFQRAAFSNEAGVGSASIAHAAVKTRYPASEGIVASIGPFVDTVIICTMTALVIVVTNLKSNLFNYSNLDDGNNVIMNGTGKHLGGVDLTSVAFDSAIPNFSILLTVAVILFAFSTMLSWSYYGIQGWKFLFGKSKIVDISYKALFLIFVVIGASSSLGSVIEFSDAMIFAMVFPNIIGLLLLAPKVKVELSKYLKAIGHKK